MGGHTVLDDDTAAGHLEGNRVSRCGNRLNLDGAADVGCRVVAAEEERVDGPDLKIDEPSQLLDIPGLPKVPGGFSPHLAQKVTKPCNAAGGIHRHCRYRRQRPTSSRFLHVKPFSQPLQLVCGAPPQVDCMLLPLMRL